MRKLIPLISLVLIFSLISCGAQNFAVDLRVALAAGAPVLDLLVSQGKISPALRAGLVLDLSNEALAVSDMASCFQAIPTGDTGSKLKHLQCVQTLDRDPRTQKLISDFAKDANVTMIADDVDAVIQAAIIFYGGVAKNSARAGGGSQPVITEKEIRLRVKKLKVDLGQR